MVSETSTGGWEMLEYAFPSRVVDGTTPNAIHFGVVLTHSAIAAWQFEVSQVSCLLAYVIHELSVVGA